ncbi:hypothetical protein D3C71_1980170 [compost metagenome]
MVIVLLDGAQGQVEDAFGDLGVLLGDGVDLQRQEIQQLGVAEGGQAQAVDARPRLFL